MQRSSTFLPASAASGDGGARGGGGARGVEARQHRGAIGVGRGGRADLALAVVEVHLQAGLHHLAVDLVVDLAPASTRPAPARRRSTRRSVRQATTSVRTSAPRSSHSFAVRVRNSALTCSVDVVAGELVGADRAHEVADVLVAGVDVDVAAVLAALHARRSRPPCRTPGPWRRACRRANAVAAGVDLLRAVAQCGEGGVEQRDLDDLPHPVPLARVQRHGHGDGGPERGERGVRRDGGVDRPIASSRWPPARRARHARRSRRPRR